MFSRQVIPLVIGAIALGAGLPCNAEASSKINLNILYLGVSSDARTADFRDFLSGHFSSVQVMERSKFDVSDSTVKADVILLDWHQGEGEFPPKSSFLGAWGELKTPAVLLGSAGLLHSVAANLLGGFG
jgi:hypothetical protein